MTSTPPTPANPPSAGASPPPTPASLPSSQTSPSSAPPGPRSRLRSALRHWGPQAIFLLVAFLGIRAWQLRGTAEGLAPAIAGRSVQDPGQELSLAALRGRPTLVYFWATWCGVCEHVDPNVAAVARDHQVLTVAVNSGRPSEIAAWMQERGLEMPTVGDPSGVLARAYGVRAFPTSFWVDGEGQIQNREVGYTSTLGLRARLWLVR